MRLGMLAPRGDETAQMSEQDRLRLLMERVQVEDRNAFRELYGLTFERVHTLVRKILAEDSDVEDALSDCYIQVWERRSQYDASRGTVVGWIVIIARSRALDIVRRRRLTSPDVDKQADDSSQTADLSLDDFSPEIQESLAAAMKSISPIQRQLVALSFFKGLTHQEISAQQSLPVGTVKSHIRRGLTALRSNLIDWENYYE